MVEEPALIVPSPVQTVPEPARVQVLEAPVLSVVIVPALEV